MRRALLVLAAVLIASALVVLAWPSVVLNSRTAAWALRRYGKAYAPGWTELNLEVGGRSLLTKRVRLRALDFCCREPHGAFEGCFPLLDLEAVVHVGRGPSVSVLRLERLAVHADALTLRPAAAPSAPRKEQPRRGPWSLAGLLPSPVRGMTLGALDVRLPKTVVVTSSGTTTARLQAAFDDKEPRPLGADAFVVLAGTAPGTARRFEAHAALDTDFFREGTLTSLMARAALRGDGGLRGRAAADIRQAGPDELKLEASAEASLLERSLLARLKGSSRPGLYAGTADLAVEDPAGPVSRAELDGCRFRAPVEERTGRPLRADLSCRITLAPKPFGPKKWPKPQPLAGSLTFDADFHPKGLHPADYFESRLRTELGLPEKWYVLRSSLALDLDGRTGDLSRSLAGRYRLDAGLDITDFAGLVSFLEGTAYAVPAPLNSLKGSASLSARAAGDVRAPGLSAGYGLDTRLAEGKEKVFVVMRGTATARAGPGQARELATVLEAELKQVALELPYLKIGEIPAPTVDTRIKTGAPGREKAEAGAGKPKPAPPPVLYAAHVFTSAPVLVYSNLLKNPAPVSLDVHAVPSGLSGKIVIDQFQTEVFRQMATIDHISLTPTPGTSVMGLDGKVVIKRSDAVIDVLLLGSTEKPQVAFQSDPPMTQQEIVSLLLFNEQPSQLTSDQQATAGNASQAFTSRAFGMASLLLFASTPIDAVNYDTTTQTYQIRFKLPGRATLSVGSNLEESRTLTLRKLLTRSLELETEVRQTARQGNAVTTFIQWFRRY